VTILPHLVIRFNAWLQVPKWVARKAWNRRLLNSAFSSSEVTVGDYKMRFRDFLLYSDQNTDDMPLYLFDKDFARKAPQLADDYEVNKTPTFISSTRLPPPGIA